MIEFALSKLNLLIFVTAIATIVIFFMGAVNSQMKNRQSYELIYKIGKEVKMGIESNSYCTVKFIDIPNKIYTNSGNSDAFSLKYKLNIAAYNYTGTGIEDYSKKIILTIVDRKEKNQKIYAAYDIDFNGVVHFFNADYQDGRYNFEKINEDPKSKESIVNLDPLKAYSIDSTILFVKKIENGIPNIYLFPCLKKNGIYQCRNYLDEAGYKKNILCLDAITDLFVGSENIG